jgi:hypothetical protein
MYYIICNKSDIPELAETTRISVDGTQVILDDVQFNSLGIDEIECQMLSQKKALALMETEEWKTHDI